MDLSRFPKKVSVKEFERICRRNGDLRFERTKDGELIAMPPADTETGHRNFLLTGELGLWVRQDNTGKGFDSSTGFTLPNGAIRSPDVSWLRRERWNALQPEQKDSFAPICPDFVIELRGAFDELETLKDKMTEYIANGVQLGWLLDPKNRKVYVYQPDMPTEILDNPATVSGEPLLRGFTLELSYIWA